MQLNWITDPVLIEITGKVSTQFHIQATDIISKSEKQALYNYKGVHLMRVLHHKDCIASDGYNYEIPELIHPDHLESLSW